MNKYIKTGAIIGVIWGLMSAFAAFTDLFLSSISPLLSKILFLPLFLSDYIYKTLGVDKIFYPFTNSWQGALLFGMVFIPIFSIIIGAIIGAIVGYLYCLFKSKR